MPCERIASEHDDAFSAGGQSPVDWGGVRGVAADFCIACRGALERCGEHHYAEGVSSDSPASRGPASARWVGHRFHQIPQRGSITSIWHVLMEPRRGYLKTFRPFPACAHSVRDAGLSDGTPSAYRALAFPLASQRTTSAIPAMKTYYVRIARFGVGRIQDPAASVD